MALHQVGKDGVERSILFLSRSLTSAEESYWSTELEAAALVWALTKLPQYFDSGPFIVVTDHSAFKTALQTKTTERRSARLNEWAMFISTFLPRMEIKHRPGKTHQNADGLSHLPSRSEEEVKVMPTRTEEEPGKDTPQPEIDQDPEGPTVVIADQSDLLTKMAFELPNDPSFGKIMAKLKNQIEAIRDENNDSQKKFQYYRLNTDTGLLYLKNKSEPDRLCIPQKFQRRLLEYAHDEHAHDGVHRTYDLLSRSMYMPKMKKTVTEYVTTCVVCQLFKPSRQLSYGQLQPIFFFKRITVGIESGLHCGLINDVKRE